MSSAYSERTRDKTSPTASTPYSDFKKSHESVVEEKTERRHTSAALICWEGIVSRMDER